MGSRPAAITSWLPENSDGHHPSAPCSNGTRFSFHRIGGPSSLRDGRQYALGAAAAADSRLHPGPGSEDHFRHHHYRYRLVTRLRGNLGWFSPPDPNRLWSVDRLRGIELLPGLLPIRRRSDSVMDQDIAIAGFYAPVHRSLTEPILLGGAPRAVAIVNGTLAAAIGLGLRLWIAGVLVWLAVQITAVWAAKRDAAFVDVVRRHLRYPQHMVA